MIRWASGSIHVVTNVARLRIGMPSRTSSSPISRMASVARHPVLGQLIVGSRLAEEPVAVALREGLEMLGEGVVAVRRPTGRRRMLAKGHGCMLHPPHAAVVTRTG